MRIMLHDDISCHVNQIIHDLFTVAIIDLWSNQIVSISSLNENIVNLR